MLCMPCCSWCERAVRATALLLLSTGASMHELVEEVMGQACVQSTFALSTSGRKKEGLPPGGGRIAGVRVTEGSVQRSATLVRVLRDGQPIHEVGAGWWARVHEMKCVA